MNNVSIQTEASNDSLLMVRGMASKDARGRGADSLSQLKHLFFKLFKFTDSFQYQTRDSEFESMISMCSEFYTSTIILKHSPSGVKGLA